MNLGILHKFAIVVPTLNPGDMWVDWMNALDEQTLRPEFVYVIDSSSQDDTVILSKKSGYKVETIDRSSFSHGKTRQSVVSKLNDMDILVFLTQDAILKNSGSLKNILTAFDDEEVAAAYGRQVPRIGAKPIEAFSRIFNYGDMSYLYSKEDIKKYGLKTAFLSNSFAAYKLPLLNKVGGFPTDVIFGEDMYVAARMLLSGYKIAYISNAEVYHSHNYSLMEEFRRYFDIGVFHHRESWLLEKFSQPQKEGLRYIKGEIRYLAKYGALNIPSACFRTLLKYVGYKMGKMESMIPASIKAIMSMNKLYWQKV